MESEALLDAQRPKGKVRCDAMPVEGMRGVAGLTASALVAYWLE